MSINSLAVVSALFGKYDNVPPVPAGFNEAVLVSDTPIKSDWQNVLLRTSLDSAVSAKIPKCRPDLFVRSFASVYVDANHRDPESWLSQAACNHLKAADLVLFRHLAALP
jgi:hypothetical protein